MTYDNSDIKLSPVVCVIGDGGCDGQGIPQNWVYFYPEGTAGTNEGYYLSNSNGMIDNPAAFCVYIGGTVYTGPMRYGQTDIGYPDICPKCSGS